jgi:hypothetical protein
MWYVLASRLYYAQYISFATDGFGRRDFTGLSYAQFCLSIWKVCVNLAPALLIEEALAEIGPFRRS